MFLQGYFASVEKYSIKQLLTSGTDGKPGDVCSIVMTSSTLDCTQVSSSLSTSTVSLNVSWIHKQCCVSQYFQQFYSIAIYCKCHYLPVVLLAMLRTFEDMRWRFSRILSTVRQGPSCRPRVGPVGQTFRWGDVLELGGRMFPSFCWNTQSLVRSVESLCQKACWLKNNTVLIFYIN